MCEMKFPVFPDCKSSNTGLDKALGHGRCFQCGRRVYRYFNVKRESPVEKEEYIVHQETYAGNWVDLEPSHEVKEDAIMHLEICRKGNFRAIRRRVIETVI